MTPTTRKSGVIAVLAASLMTSSTQFAGKNPNFWAFFMPKMPLMAALFAIMRFDMFDIYIWYPVEFDIRVYPESGKKKYPVHSYNQSF